MKRFLLTIILLNGLLARAQQPDSLVQPIDAFAQHLLDSLDRVRNRPTFTKVVIEGYAHHNRRAQRYINLGPLLDNLVQYNTVEGWVLGQHVDYNQALRQGKRFLSTSFDVRYGFASQRFYAQNRTTYWFDRARNQYGQVEIGRFVRQFNPDEPITYLQNTNASLLWGRNYLKLYQSAFAGLRFRQPLGSRLALIPSIEISTRTPLRNESNRSLRGTDKRRFTSNNPLEPEGNSVAFPRHRAYLGELALSYEIENGPALTLGYRRTLAGQRTDADFSKLWLNFRQNIYREPWGELHLEASAGTFLTNRRVYFTDYWHFSGNQLLAVRHRLSQFFLLPYYSHSTDQRFVQVVAEHHFNGYFLGRNPTLRLLGWHELVGLRLLNTPEKKLYLELNAGVENVFNLIRLDLITAFGEPFGSKFAIRYAIGL